MNIVLLLLCNFLASSHSAPEPDTHLHFYLPPEGETPNTGGNYGADYGADYDMTIGGEQYAEQIIPSQLNIPGGEKCTSGKKQSPINITSKTVRYQEFPPFKLVGHDKLALRLGTVTIKNKKGASKGDKPTIKVVAKENLVPQNGGLLSGGPLRVPYLFQEMHLHWGDPLNEANTATERLYTGSEHNIDGKGSALELHMVHKNIHDKTLKESLEHEDGLAVLAFRFRIVDKEDDKFRLNEGLDHLTNISYKHLKKSGSKFEKKDIPKDSSVDVNVMSFLPVLMDEYFYYKGSLTTGTCDEAVNWIVFKNLLAINTYQIKRLQFIEDESGKRVMNNFREAQKLNGRPIYYHGRELVETGVIGYGTNPQAQIWACTKAPKIKDFLLTLPNCLNYQTATMYDYKKDDEYRKLWNEIPCQTLNPSDKILGPQ